MAISVKMRGHRSRDVNELVEAKNRVKLKKNVFSNKKDFRDMFNDFMAPRPSDTIRAQTIMANQDLSPSMTMNASHASSHTLLRKPL